MAFCKDAQIRALDKTSESIIAILSGVVYLALCKKVKCERMRRTPSYAAMSEHETDAAEVQIYNSGWWV